MPGWSITASGRVQGVGFRWFVQDCAYRHQITGYAQNASDGTVRILACGDAEDLRRFTADVKLGHRHAEVAGLEIEELEYYTGYEDFVIA